VALLGDETGRITSVWRDPSGMVEAFTWRLREDVDVVSDAVWDLPWGLSPPRLSINWDRLALGLADPVAAIANPPLDGFVAVGAGMLRSLGSTPSTIGVWRPGDHTADPRMDAVSASAALSKTVDQCTAALVSRSGRYLGEISGGLDSAIVAASVVRSGLQGRAAGWLNVWSRLGGADERSYARHVARHLGVPLREVELMPAVFSDEDYVGLLDGVRPPLTAASREYDRCVRGLAEALGAEALLTGEGGDAVLFQSPSPLVVADLLRIRGPAAFLGPELAQYARRARRSVWSLAATAIAALGGRSEWPQARIPLAGATEPAVPWRHPWLEGIEALPPAKRLHVLAVTNAQVHTADSARRQVAEPLNPLLAQPVVELCLSLPTPLLTLGARDRGLARRAFRDRLPAEIIERRSKGDMALFYGQVVSRGLPWLREHLLGGCLVEAGVLDARRLEPALTSERLAWRGGASAVLGAALTETWVRHWQRRVPDTIGAVRGPHPESRAALA
jgi:asparagine synthase (glutamine-hydrolysing)